MKLLTITSSSVQNNRGQDKSYQPQPLASVNNSYWDFDYSGYHKKTNLINNGRKKWPVNIQLWVKLLIIYFSYTYKDLCNMHFVIYKNCPNVGYCVDNSVIKSRESFLQIYWRVNVDSKPWHYFTSISFTDGNKAATFIYRCGLDIITLI